MTKTDIVEEYCLKFPSTNNTGIAKKLKKDFPIDFPDVEKNRSLVRYVKGLFGKKERKYMRIKPLPKSEARAPKTHKFKTKDLRVLAISDIHLPYHDYDALEIALKAGLDFKANAILINGDLMDMYQGSKFDSHPARRSIADEFAMTREFLEILRAMYPEAEIVWLEGNHEERYKRYLMTNAPKIFNDDEFNIPKRLNLSDLNIKYIESFDRFKIGGLNVWHGHQIVKGVFAPVNAARGVFMKGYSNFLIGHQHQASSHAETSFDGKEITVFSQGCLCTLSPEYSSFNSKHCHGFALIESDGKEFSVMNKRIVKGKVKGV